MARHRDITATGVGLTIEEHRHTGPGVSDLYDAAGSVPRVGARRRWGPALGRHSKADTPSPKALRKQVLSLGFHADPLADVTVILAIEAVPALRPAPDRRLQTDLTITQPSGRLVAAQ